MRRIVLRIGWAGLACLIFATSALAVGEDMLAMTGQYTFFIKPDPCSCITYTQKLVPCIETKCVGAKRVVTTFPLPVPRGQRQPILVTETPVGCAEGAGPCIQCYPQPSCRPDVKECPTPAVLPVPVPSVEPEPRTVTRPVMLPQWFVVQEQCKPPARKVRKVRQ